ILDTPLFETTVISDDEDSGKAAAREPAETADPEPAVVPAEVVDLDGESAAAETAAPELAVPTEVVDLGDKPARSKLLLQTSRALSRSKFLQTSRTALRASSRSQLVQTCR
ncbi:unnamed protein product, partial [Symbiodinium necroappetens]